MALVDEKCDLAANYVVVLTTVPPGGSEKIARALVEERLAACVNVSRVRSYFTWQGKPSAEDEELMIMKTEARLANRVGARIRELHSYELPEVVVLPISGGDESYLRWISDSVA